MARLPSITSKDQIPAQNHAIADAIISSRGALHGPFTMFLHSPELTGRVAHLGAYVRYEGSLDMRVRVLAVMTVAHEFDAVYVCGAKPMAPASSVCQSQRSARFGKNTPVICRRKTLRLWLLPGSSCKRTELTT